VALGEAHRLHGQRRWPRHGDHGHHQALRRSPNFLDVGGGAAARKVAALLRSSPPIQVKDLVNIFGGIMSATSSPKAWSRR
jgi:hypothetical protein